MRAIGVFPGRREVALVSEAEPLLSGPRDVKLRILDVGVCGTDKEICAFEYGTPPAGLEHLVIGHESLGEVVEIGQAVDGFLVGDLVVPTVRRPCPHGHCLTCRAGRQDYCTTFDFRERGIKELHGFMTEFVVDDQRYLNRVPRELRAVGVLVEPLTIAEKSLLQLWDVQRRLAWTEGDATQPGKGLKAVVLGAGPVGLLGAMALVVRGFETYVYSRELESEPRAQLVGSFGAHYVSSQGANAAQLAERMGRIDLVYEAVGIPALAFDVAQHLAPNAAFIFTGVPALKGPISIEADKLMRSMVLKNQVLLGSVNSGKDGFLNAIRDLAVFQGRWPQALAQVISGRFPAEAHRDLLLGRAPGIKNVISFDLPS